MCLVSKTKFPKIALRKIKVYKILTDFNKSPIFGNYQYAKGINIPVKESKKSSYRTSKSCIINGGYLHAYRTKSEAEFAYANYTKPINYHIVEMYIPIFTRYCIGIYGIDICAKKLIW